MGPSGPDPDARSASDCTMMTSRGRLVGASHGQLYTNQEYEVEGEDKQHERRPKDQRNPEEKGGHRSGSETGSRDRNRGRRSGGGGGRKGAYRFDDQMEHAICQLVTHQSPKGFPAISRTDLATMPPTEVARTGSSILLCDGQHEGPHLWPNGDEVP